jgi:hypothetical protein
MPKTSTSTKTRTKAAAKRSMSDDHKQALAQGRQEGRVVRDYLSALRAFKPRRGRRRTADSINARLATIEQQIVTASPIDELRLHQERRDLLAELATVDNDLDITNVEAAFVEVAASYSARHGISYASWREVGVPAHVLKRANLSRSA